MDTRPAKIRILVADDDPIICDAYEAFLTEPDAAGSGDIGLGPEVGIELVCCGQAEEAVEEVARALQAAEPFALAFLDVNMPPGRDGVWAAEQIRKLDAAIEISIVTAYSDISPAEITSRVPPADKLLYLQKPFHPHEITQFAAALGAKWLAERNLAGSLVRLATAQRIAKFGHWEYDPQTREARWSDEMGRLFGISTGEGAGPLEALWQHVHAEDKSRVLAGIERVLAEGQSPSLDYRICLPDGTERFIQHEVVSISGSSADAIRLVGAALDVTERKKNESRIQYLAFHDQLTGLLNRSFLNQHMPRVLKQAGRKDDYAALLYLDLDHFKRVNDTLGHSAGDELLQEVARRLTDCVRESDCIARASLSGSSSATLDGVDPVARLGGDEFIVLLPEVTEPEDPARVAERIRSALVAPFQIGGSELHISSSIGIALYPKDGCDVESLLQKADLALYQAKDDGRNNFRFYTETLNDQALERLTRETELRRALSQEDFLLYYQPTVDARSGTLRSAEALIRWQHPELGLVLPGEFIPLAEETGLIVPLGHWVMREACAQMERWQRDGQSPHSLSVNLSFRQFRDEELIPQLKQIIHASSIDPRHLVVEFTESALMDDTELTAHILSQLKGLGLRSAMDDFGTGYSSLSYLKRLPIDILKMDRSFVRGLDTDKTDEAIAKAIITMAQELKLQVTAEGVERQAQLDLLRVHGCDLVQGYLIDRPMPADEFARRWLSKAG